MTSSNVEPIDDYEDLIGFLNSHGVEYVIVGAYAVALHGFLRATGDLDIFVKPSPENAVKIAAAVKGFIGVEVDPAELSRPKVRLRLGEENGIDIITSISGVTWDEAWSDRVAKRFGEHPACFVSREKLIQNKKSAGRPKDHFDLQGLGAEDAA